MIAVPLLIEVGKLRFERVTEDVSDGGLFVRVDEPLALRTLVRVELMLPPHGSQFSATGRIVHHVPAVRGIQDAGVGIEFYGIGADVRGRWEKFVNFVREHFPESSERAAILANAEGVKPLFKRNAEHVQVLSVHLRSLEDLVTLLRRDIRDRRMFVLTPIAASPGDLLGLWITHPHTGDVFEIEARVERRVVDGGLHGLRLQLELSNERATRLEEFAYDAMEPLFDEEDVEEAETSFGAGSGSKNP